MGEQRQADGQADFRDRSSFRGCGFRTRSDAMGATAGSRQMQHSWCCCFSPSACCGTVPRPGHEADLRESLRRGALHVAAGLTAQKGACSLLDACDATPGRRRSHRPKRERRTRRGEPNSHKGGSHPRLLRRQGPGPPSILSTSPSSGLPGPPLDPSGAPVGRRDVVTRGPRTHRRWRSISARPFIPTPDLHMHRRLECTKDRS